MRVRSTAAWITAVTLTASNYVMASLKTPQAWDSAFERSFFQAVAILCFWLAVSIVDD